MHRVARTFASASLLMLAACGSSGGPPGPGATASPTPPPAGRTLYVSPSGSDGNDGLSEAKPFATLQKAADSTRPGDTVYVMTGVWSNANKGYFALLDITISGEPGRPIRYMAMPGHRPRIHFDCYVGIRVSGASYIEISGFEIQGDKAGLTLADAERLQSENLAELDNDGISVGPPGSHSSPRPPYPTHVTIQGNHVHHCSGAGIGVYLSDYVTIQGNAIHSNAWYSPWAKSGISIGWGWNSDTATTTKNFVLGNALYDNEALIPWRAIKDYSDGNGLIVDSMNNHDKPAYQPYTGRTLVANNLSYSNGGSGIHAFKSDHVDIVNNTAYMNSRSPHLEYGSIFAGDCKDVRLYNNVAVARAGEPVNASWNNEAVVYDFNVWFGGKPPVAAGAHDIVADPLFVNAAEAGGTYRLKPGSPGLDTGTAELAPKVDIEGRARPAGSAVDRGAYEGPAS